ncbi:MAG: lyase family protein [Ignisphaera sp.]
MKRYKVLVGGVSKDSIDSYVSSIDFDKKLAKYVAMVMLAHLKNLVNSHLITIETAKKISYELIKIIETEGRRLYEWIEKREEKFEDVFEALEIYLFSVVGEDAGRIAIGRSRNDHISAVLRLSIRDHMIKLLLKLLDLREAFIDKSNKYRETLFPFFTHAQLAQCGSATLYFLTYEYTFSNVWKILLELLELVNQNPLGSGASAGTSVPLNKDVFAKLLCFDSTPLPPYYATGSRLFMLSVASIFTILMTEIGRFVEDMMIMNNIVPHGLEVPREHISTSSIMPHKRNLVTLEIARAKVSRAIGLLTALLSSYKSVPYGYNLDFQEMNIYFYELVKDLDSTLEIITDFIKGLEINSDAINKYLSDKPCWSSDIIEYISINTNIPVRNLYARLAEALQEYWRNNTDPLKSFLKSYGLELADVWKIVKQKPIEKELDVLMNLARERIARDYERVKQINTVLMQCSEELIKI